MAPPIAAPGVPRPRGRLQAQLVLPSSGRTAGRSVAVAVALHLAVLIALAWPAATRDRGTTHVVHMTAGAGVGERITYVSVARAPAPAPPAPAAPAPTRPQPAPHAPTPPVARARPTVRPATAPAKAPAQAPRRTAKTPSPRRATTPASPASPATAAAPSPGVRGSGSDVVSVQANGRVFPFPGYLENIVHQIALRFEPGRHAGLSAEVRFLIQRAGDVVEIRVTRSSGAYAFDTEARAAIEAAGHAHAFGALPAGFPDDVLPVTFSFSPALGRH